MLYTGDATFEIIGDDGYSQSDAVTVTVDVSDAALISLDFVERNPFLLSGQRTQLELIGDFADQENVLLSGDYLTWVSSDETIVTVDEKGNIQGVTDGNSVISAKRNNLEAVTVASIGIPSDVTEQAILILGIDVILTP